MKGESRDRLRLGSFVGLSPWHGLWAFLLHSLKKNPLHRAIERRRGLAQLLVNCKAHGWFIHQPFLLKYLLYNRSVFLDTGLVCDPTAGVSIPHPTAHLTEAGVWFHPRYRWSMIMGPLPILLKS